MPKNKYLCFKTATAVFLFIYSVILIELCKNKKAGYENTH